MTGAWFGQPPGGLVVSQSVSQSVNQSVSQSVGQPNSELYVGWSDSSKEKTKIK
jgi:hypothetical protein